MKRILNSLGRGLALMTAWSLMLGSPLAYAGDLNAETNSMFNSLGGMSNYTQPGAFKGQSFNTYSGGSIYMRTPNKTYTLYQLTLPSARGGCGGISAFGGAFSHISASELKDMLKKINAALPGIAFQLAVEAVSPLLGGNTKWAQTLQEMVRGQHVNSCQLATAMVGTAADAIGFSSQKACANLAQMGVNTYNDNAEAVEACRKSGPSIIDSARKSGDTDSKAEVPFVGNLTWEALKSTPLDDKEKEFVLSIVGTVIYPVEGSSIQPYEVPPTIKSIRSLLYGEADASNGSVTMTLIKCGNADCTDISKPADYKYEPFTKKVEDMMRNISNKIKTRSGFSSSSPEVAFVNHTREPVWRMLSIGNTLPESDLADEMIQEYKEVIAADYAYTFLSAYANHAIAGLAKHWHLNTKQTEDSLRLRRDAQVFMQELSKEKQTLYAQRVAIGTTAAQLEQMERQLRHAIPQHVIDMLGQNTYAVR